MENKKNEQEVAKLTCQEFCAITRTPAASLEVFRKSYLKTSSLPENKDLKTKAEWIDLYTAFIKA